MTRIGFVALLVLAAAAHAAQALTVEQLFDALSRERPGRATFEERKFLSLLDRPVESSGELTFTPPGRLEKRTLKPRAESLVVDGDLVTIERAGRRRTFALADQPELGVLVESIRGTLAGDLRALSRHYTVDLDGSLERWRLFLRPTEPSVAALVNRVEIGGARAEVRTIEIVQGDGDRSVMTISPSR